MTEDEKALAAWATGKGVDWEMVRREAINLEVQAFKRQLLAGRESKDPREAASVLLTMQLMADRGSKLQVSP